MKDAFAGGANVALVSQLTGGVRLAVAPNVKPELLLDPASSRPTRATMLPPTSAAMMDTLEYRRLKRATRNDRIGARLLSIMGAALEVVSLR
jgi:hypothetical protein